LEQKKSREKGDKKGRNPKRGSYPPKLERKGRDRTVIVRSYSHEDSPSSIDTNLSNSQPELKKTKTRVSRYYSQGTKKGAL